MKNTLKELLDVSAFAVVCAAAGLVALAFVTAWARLCFAAVIWVWTL